MTCPDDATETPKTTDLNMSEHFGNCRFSFGLTAVRGECAFLYSGRLYRVYGSEP